MAEMKISSISELMRMSDLSRGAIEKVYHERNLENINLSTLVALCKVFNCTLDDLIQIIDDNNIEDNKEEPSK